MSKFEFLQQQIQKFEMLDNHTDPVLAKRLLEVQIWQKNRMQTTHAEFFAKPQHQLMTAYFLNRLYGASDFDELAKQIRRLIKHAQIVERIIPASALKTGDAGVELAVLSIDLDEQVAKYLLQHYAPDAAIHDEMMRLAYIAIDQADARHHQMQLLEILGEKLDLYVRSKVVKTAFKLSKGLAYRYKVEPIYEFIDEGFKAMEPLESAKSFVSVFTAKEKEIINAVHHGHPRPFEL